MCTINGQYFDYQTEELDVCNCLHTPLPAPIFDWLGNFIAAEIGNLVLLRELNLGCNDTRITSLPPTIQHLTLLRHLHLTFNSLITVPPEIGDLRHLTRLDVSHNKLISLPATIGHLTSLNELN